MPRVYLDHNATTPLDPRVREAMLPWLGERHGNPSSVHAWGQEAREAVESARSRVAAALGARSPELVFTASGTEALNAVILSHARAAGFDGHLVVSALEHPAVREAAAVAEAGGMALTRVPPGPDGVVAADAMLAALRRETRLVCLMLAHNEIGTLQPVRQVAAPCRERGVPLLCDAVQAVGKVSVRVDRLGADYVVIGAHKFSGPLGAAALWIRPGAELTPLLVGGSQERRRRAGTENVPALVGLGVAAELAAGELERRHGHLLALRERFERGLARIPGALVHGAAASRLPNTSHVALPGADAEALVIRLDLAGYAVSTGSACASGAVEPSETLLAMGVGRDEALASLRVSFGTSNTAEEVDAFLDSLAHHVAELRRLASADRAPGR